MKSLETLSKEIDKNYELLQKRAELEEKAIKSFSDNFPDTTEFDKYMKQVDEIELD